MSAAISISISPAIWFSGDTCIYQQMDAAGQFYMSGEVVSTMSPTVVGSRISER